MTPSTILVVSDPPTELDDLLARLEAENYLVEIATSGQTALEAIAKGSPCLILLDTTLPDLDSFTLFCQLKQVEQIKDTMVVFLAATPDDHLEAKALRLGATDFIAKSTRLEILHARLKRHLVNQEQLEILNEKTSQLTREIKQQKEIEKNLLKTNDELSTLNLITQTVTSVHDLPIALEIVAGTITRLFAGQSTMIGLLDEAKSKITILAHYPFLSPHASLAGLRLSLPESPLLQKFIMEEKPITINQAQSKAIAGPIYDFMVHHNSYCLITIPLQTRGHVIGLIMVATDQADQIISSDETKLINKIGHEIASIVEVTRIFEKEQHHRKISESLREVALILNRSLNQETVLDELLEQLARVVKYDGAGVFLVDTDSLLLFRGVHIAVADLGQRIPLASQDPAVRAYAQPDPLILADVHDDPYWQTWPGGDRIRGWMGAALLDGERSIGVLTVDSFDIGAYSQQDAQILQIFANHAAIAIANARLFEATQNALQQAETLYTTALTLSANMELEQLLQTILTEIKRVVPYDSASILVIRENRLELTWRIGLDDDTSKKITLDIETENNLAQQVVKKKAPIIVPDVQVHPVWQRKTKEPQVIRAWAGIPLMFGDEILGVICLDKYEADFYTETHARLALALAAQATIAIKNAELLSEEQHQRQLAQSRNEELDAFAHTVAHDVKHPLGIIVGYADFLVTALDDLPADKVLDIAKTIRQAGLKGAIIVDELLLLAGVRKQNVTKKPLVMTKIIEQVQQRLILMVEEVQAELILPETWPTAIGHAPWVEEVWVNYVSNGLKYGGDPPRLVFGATPQPDKMIRFWIRDNGPGLSLDKQATLFTEFTRFDEVRAQGHGLGLSIVHRIAEKLGGEVGVESMIGEGSTFYFTLPSA